MSVSKLTTGRIKPTGINNPLVESSIRLYCCFSHPLFSFSKLEFSKYD